MIDDSRIEDFFKKIDDWISSSGFISQSIKIEKINEILSKDIDEIKEMSHEDILLMAIYLYKYVDSLQESYNKEQSVINFCESSILYISGDKIMAVGDQYTKWDIKFIEGLKKSELSSKLFQLLLSSRAKIVSVEKRIEYVRKQADLLSELGRKKKYEHN